MEFIEQFNVRQLDNLELLARQVVEGFIIGLHKSPFHGFSVEFAEHRLYNQGESTKNIDWKVYARTDKLFTKKYEEETNLRCQIVIDQSASMYYPEVDLQSKDFNKLRFSVLASACLMNLLRRQRDAFGLSLFDEQLVRHTPTKSSLSHYRLLLTYMEQILKEPPKQRKTSTAQALHQIAERVHRRSLIVIFSDMFENHEEQEAVFAALQHLKHAKHEVVLFHTLDKATELEFEYSNRPYLFEDLETGEKLKLRPHQVKDEYVKRTKEFLHNLKMKCLQYKIQFVETDIQQGFTPVLHTFLTQRKKMY